MRRHRQGRKEDRRSGDDEGQVERLSRAAVEAGVVIGLVIDIDLGDPPHRRPAGRGRPLARLASVSAGLEYRGSRPISAICSTWPISTRAAPPAPQGRQRLSALVGELTRGLKPAIVTGAAIGTYADDLGLRASSPRSRPGPTPSWTWNTRTAARRTASLGLRPVPSCSWRPAWSRPGTRPTRSRRRLKAHSVDGLAARVVAGAPAGARWRPMGDEHAAIYHPAHDGALNDRRFAEAVLEADAGTPPRHGPLTPRRWATSSGYSRATST